MELQEWVHSVQAERVTGALPPVVPAVDEPVNALDQAEPVTKRALRDAERDEQTPFKFAEPAAVTSENKQRSEGASDSSWAPVPDQLPEPVLPPVKTEEEIEQEVKEWKPKFVCLAKSLDHVRRRPRDKRYMLILPNISNS